MSTARGAKPGVQAQAAFFEDMLRRLAALERASGGASGFTFYGEATPTTTRDGHTWFKPSTAAASVWSAGAWVTY